MVGANHPTLADTLNRGFLIQHGADGVHTIVPYATLTGVPTTFPWDNLTGTPTTLAGYGITDNLSALISLPWDNVTGTPTTIAGYGITDSMVQDNVAITGGTISTTTITLIDNSVAPEKLQYNEGSTGDNTLFYRSDGKWMSPSVSFQDQIDLKQALDPDLTVLSYLTNWVIVYSNGSHAVTELPLGASGTYLKSNGPAAAPTFSTVTATTATALAANGANCSAGQAPLGVDNTGAVEGCWTPAANLDNTTMDNTTVGVTIPLEGHFTTLSATGDISALSTASTAGLHTFSGGSVHNDNQYATFGTDNDFQCRYRDDTQQYVCLSTDTETASDTDAAYYFVYASGGTIGAGQRIFAVAKDTDNVVFYVDDSGNVDAPGTATFGEVQTDCSYDDNTCYFNAADVGPPSSPIAGDTYYDNTAKVNQSYDGTNWRYGQYDALEFVIGNGTDVITPGEKGHIEVPYPCDIQSIRLFADASGSIVVDLWKDTYANFPPTIADNVTGTGTKPTLSSAQKSEVTDFTDYTTTTLAAGDVIAYYVEDSVNTVKRVTISIRVRK